ncbi:MAG TPA: hypothetical protein VNA28_02240 [Solirubrobacteraceae bacterium]|nr:hypothetical protein [Solirubrobacteraceae bacterium]
MLISGFRPQLLYRLISGYLAQLPKAADGHAYVLDRNAAVLGDQTARKTRPGQPVAERGLAEAVARGRPGSFGDGRWFAASPVKNSQWTCRGERAPERALRAGDGRRPVGAVDVVRCLWPGCVGSAFSSAASSVAPRSFM